MNQMRHTIGTLVKATTVLRIGQQDVVFDARLRRTSHWCERRCLHASNKFGTSADIPLRVVVEIGRTALEYGVAFQAEEVGGAVFGVGERLAFFAFKWLLMGLSEGGDEAEEGDVDKS